MQDLIEKFYKKIEKQSNGCWEWQAQRDHQGYGRFKWNKGQCAHRFSANVIGGMNIDGMLVCHKCDNPSCVNPAHLFVGTQKDNMKDMFSKNRKILPNGENHWATKLSDNDIKYIRENTIMSPGRRNKNIKSNVSDIAIKFNVKEDYVRRIVTNKIRI
jgi:hypothetical protein